MGLSSSLRFGRIGVLCLGLVLAAGIGHAQSGTGELGSFNFDGSNPTSGLAATGAPAISTLNSHTPPHSLSFPAGNNYESYTLSSATSVLYTRQYIDFSSIGSTSNAFLRLYHGSGELMTFFLSASSGNPSYYNQATGATTTISSTALSTGTIHLVELYAKISATAGQVICKIDGTTVYTSAATLNTGTSTIDTVWFGQIGNTAPVGWGTTYMDNVDFSAIGWIGPINPNPGTGELGSFNFDGSNPTSGLVATGAPAISTLNSHTPPNSLSFPAGNNYEVYTLPSATSVLYTRQYIDISSIGSNSNAFLRLYHGSSELMSIFLNTSDGHPSYYNQATGATTTISSTPISAGTVHLVELYAKISATAGQVICKIDGTTVYTSAATLNTGTSTIDTVWFGQLGNTAPVGWGTTYMDNVDVSAIGWIGPINVAAAPVFSPVPGTYTAAQAVSMTDSTTGAKIYYTTDGSTPTIASSLYTQAINVGSTETVQAIAIAPNYANSAITSGNYAIANPPVISGLSPSSGLVGTSVTISGSNFGASQGSSTVSFNGTAATPASWSGSSIVVPVPTGATTGNVVVTVGGSSSNGSLFTVTQPPAISGLSPASGVVGTSVTISGSNFGASHGSSTVSFNGTAATPTSWSAASIVVPVPAGATTGNVVVTVGGSSSNGSLFTVTQPPTISGLSPASGIVGTSVTISGSNFGTSPGSSTVSFNGTNATPTSWSASSIVVPVPTGANTGNVVVTVGGISSNGSLYTVVLAPSMSGLSPSSGPPTTLVTISGSYFGANQGSSTVSFNGTSATPTSWSDSSITVPVPAGATTGNVVVIVSGSSSNGSLFTVIPAPSIRGLSPSAGVVGTSVTISGSNFGASKGSSTVSFNGTNATPTNWSATSIVVPVPSGASTGDVLVTVGGIGSNSSLFTVFQAPCSQCTNSPNLTLSCTLTTVTPPQTTVCTARLAPTAIGAVSMGTSAGDTIAVQPDETGAATQANVLVSAPAGTYTYTATFPGDNYFAPASASVTLTSQTGTTPSNLELSCSPITSGGSQAATCGAQLTPGSTGYVAFVSTAFHVFAPINSSGQAIISTPFVGLPQGSYEVNASYGGDGTYAASSGDATVLVDSGTPTSESLPSQVSISCNPLTAMAPQTTSCMAQVPTGATGTVTISYVTPIYGQFQTTVPVDGIGDATATNLFVGAGGGTYTVTAAYSGDSAYAVSSATTSVTVVQAGTNPGTVPDIQPPTIAMGCQGNTATGPPIPLNGTSDCRAWVSPGATGYVTYTSSATGRTIAEPIDASGNTYAPNEVSNVPAGTYTVTARYGGDQTYAGGWTFVGVAVANSNGPTTPSMSLSCSPDSVAPSETITCTAQLPTTATGSVSFTLGGTALGSPSVNSLGQATISAAVPATTGTYTMTASYSGDGNFLTATAQSQVTVTTSGGEGGGGGTTANCSLSSTSIYGFAIVDANNNPGYAPNGDVANYCDSVMGAWTASYDNLDRLQSASVAGGPYDGMTMAWNIDTFGNRLSQTTSVHIPPQNTPGLTFNNANNRADQFTYDSAGNVKNDGRNIYLYDGANRICAVNSSGALTGYLYDAEGRRVAKGTLSQFTCDITSNGFTLSEQSVLGQSGEQFAAIEQTSGVARINVFAQGALLGTYDSNVNGFQFAFNDWLGTKRVQYSLVQGAATETCSSLPYGDSLSCQGFDATDHHFTGKERDQESLNDYFGARYFGSGMGRFLSPDYLPLDGDDPPIAVPNGAITDPQTLNLYTFTQNSPLSRRDYDGHASWQPCAGDPNSQCWTGDYNGELNNGLFWNAQSQQWQRNDPTPPPLNDPAGVFFTGLYRGLTAQTMGQAAYGARQMATGMLLDFPTMGAKSLAALFLPWPSFVPQNWTESSDKKGTGVVFKDPANSGNQVRYSQGDPGSSNPGQQKPYLVIMKNGQRYGADGNQVPRNSMESHLPQSTEFPPDFFGPVP